MTRPLALIAGAGIGGLCAALCLARVGWRVNLFEQADQLQEAGAGLQLSPNASVILRGLGVLERFRAAALAPRATRVRRASDGATLAVLPLADAEARWGAPYLLVHRADLQRALLEAVAIEPAITLHTGAGVVDFVARGDAVTISLAGQRDAAGDLLICADGVRSRLREKLFGAIEAKKFMRRTAWRTLVPAGSVAPEMLRAESGLWLGPRAHLVHYPLRGGLVVNLVAVIDEDQGAAEPEDVWSSPGDPALIETRFASWARPARDLISAAPDWRIWRLVESERLARWTLGRVALLGDSAHPMLPFLAQGAAQAIEDAAALSEAVSRDADIEGALEAYHSARQGRADRVQLDSRRQGTIYHLSGAAALARDVAMRALGGQRLLDRYDWLYRVRGTRSAPTS